jgi:hypothetical protein
MKLNSEDKKDIRYSLILMMVNITVSLISLTIQFYLKDEMASIKIATFLNTCSCVLLAVPQLLLFYIILDKRIKEQLKKTHDEDEEKNKVD